MGVVMGVVMGGCDGVCDVSEFLGSLGMLTVM